MAKQGLYTVKGTAEANMDGETLRGQGKFKIK
jgi:hypothetical protein